MEITGYEVISKNPQIIKLIKPVKSGQSKENDTYIGFSEVIADDDDIHKIIIINEHSFTMMDKHTYHDKLILITKQYKYIPLIEGKTDRSNYCEYERMKGTCLWDYEFKNQKLVINCNSHVREDAVQYNTQSITMKLEVVYLNNNYDYKLTNKIKYYNYGPYNSCQNDSSMYLEYIYDVNTRKYKIIHNRCHAQSSSTISESTMDMDISKFINTLPLIKCTVIGEDDEIIKLIKENESLKQQLASETERLQKEYQLLLEENKLKKENIVIPEIKKEYKNCKRCLDKHTSENELCDECIG